MAQAARNQEDSNNALEDHVVKIFRCSKVVKGGRNFSFAALVVVGNRKGEVGFGYAKANEVPPSVEKAIKEARRSLQAIQLSGSTIPHMVKGRFGATSIVLVPADPGTGIIAGGSASAVLRLVGVNDVLTKIYGSTNPKNVVKATMNALLSLRSRETIEKLRGTNISAS
ncbi:MAG: 30S ribosomal protein S5 [Sedimentisphaerales bacterium]|nr:30S ribosomal protein S5 [Sedimentisphaerales bacterium]